MVFELSVYVFKFFIAQVLFYPLAFVMFQSKYYKIITLFVNLCFKLFLLLELLFMYLSSFGMIYNTSVLPLGNDMLYYINIAIEKIG